MSLIHIREANPNTNTLNFAQMNPIAHHHRINLINENAYLLSILNSDNHTKNYKTMLSHILAVKNYVRSNSRSHFYVKNKNIIITDYTLPNSMFGYLSCICNKDKKHWIKKEYTEEELDELVQNEMKWHINNPCNYWELPNEYYKEL